VGVECPGKLGRSSDFVSDGIIKGGNVLRLSTELFLVFGVVVIAIAIIIAAAVAIAVTILVLWLVSVPLSLP